MMRQIEALAAALLIGCSSLLFGCGKAARRVEQAPSAFASAHGGSPHVVTSEPLSSSSAFELALAGDHLKLVWATASAGPNWLRSADLAQDGAPSSVRAVTLPARSLGTVTDLAGVGMGQELALAWIEQGKTEARAEAWLSGAGPSALIDLGPAGLSAEAARGNIQIAPESERGRTLVMWRGLQAPCIEAASAPCTAFTFRRLSGATAENSGLPLSVPAPCTAHSVQLFVSSGRFHYGVCTRDGADPVTTMFSIQYDPEYARAEPLLKGCVPLGTVEAAGKPWLVGDCHGKRKAATIPLSDEKVETAYVDALRVSCTAERAELRQGAFTVTLREPRANLQAILPPALAPSGARAGWSGSSLVVAYLAGERLETRAFACRGGTLAPL
jgi:hypothetical protein